jgi:predicted aspartyl protease
MSIQLARRALLLVLALGGGARADDAPPACHYVKMATLPLSYLGNAFHPAVDGNIIGAPARLLVDTGADQSSLTRTATHRLDLPLRMTGTYATGLGGSSRVYSARVQDFGVGPIHSGKASLLVIGDTGVKPQHDALIGADFLLQADMEMSLAEKQLRFYRPNNCADSFLAYWSGDAIEVPFTGSFGRSRNPVFTVELNGKKLNAVIDSGAEQSVVFAAGARKAGVRTDSPGVKRSGSVVGVGSDHVARWRAVFDTFAIGDETIKNAEIAIIDASSADADMLLGADFLRAHRVLFAMSQKRLYISYLGGAVFSADSGIAPWLQQEADGGNPNAQYLLAARYLAGSGVPADRQKGASWLQKAAVQGHPEANLLAGRLALAARRFNDAANSLSQAASQLPDNPRAPLYLYLARLQAGDAATAARELGQRLGADKAHAWPAPVGDFYLGRIDADALFALAGKQAQPIPHVCDALYFVAELYGAQGDPARAAALRESKRAECGKRAGNQAAAPLPTDT